MGVKAELRERLRSYVRDRLFLPPLERALEDRAVANLHALIMGRPIDTSPIASVTTTHVIDVCPCCDEDARTCGHAPCVACKGTGSSCADCKGTGKYVGYGVVERCKTCDGARCEACGGSGW